jgi:putative heme-binding domain-containing protein
MPGTMNGQRFRGAIGATYFFLLFHSPAATPLEEDYNQWKQALHTNAATAAAQITALPGFQVELLRSAQPAEGSWVAMTFDPRGRLVIAREDRGLLRFTLPTPAAPGYRIESLNTNLLECRGLLFAYDALYANANNSKGLYRLRDTDGDDQFDEVKLLRATPGGVGHGRNQLALGPDGMIYSIHGDDVGLPPEGVSTNSPYRHYAEDRLLPCDWDKHLFNAYAKMPYGHLIRTDRDGQSWELIAGGLRNPFGLDFNAAGDLFTFEADMEWDAGLSWYHPTRVLHLVPGGDYGWRRGTGVLPVWSPDTLPSVADIGLSSPTAVKFGTKSRFPEPWRSALFILDWAYGKIHAVHLSPAGATYKGRAELFLKGRPLNVTGLDFGPDGAMYFVTGGRRTQSGLYRVTWSDESRHDGGQKETRSALTPALSPGERRKRRPLSVESRGAQFLMEQPKVGPVDSRPSTLDRPAQLTRTFTELNSPDPWRRHAARVALEGIPVTQWRERALVETRPTAAFTALLALARADEASSAPALLRRLRALASTTLTAEQQLLGLRALGLCFLRLGRPDRATAAEWAAFWEARYPSADARVNESLCELLVYLDSNQVVQQTMPLLERAATQEEKLHYLFTLRRVKAGWNLGQRRAYFAWLARARREFQGANMLPTALNYIRADAEATLSPAEHAALTDVLAALDQPIPPPPAPTADRRFVQAWTMTDFVDAMEAVGHGRNAARGRRLFTDTGCAQCHRLKNEGGLVGPDLTSVGGRFDRRTLLESMIEPSKVIAEIYRSVTLTLKSGVILDGHIVSEDESSVSVAINPVDPEQRRRVAKTEIASQRVSAVSPMPEGLLNTLTREEIFDLLAWLETGGDANQPHFKP